MCGIAGIARKGGVGDADAIQAQKMGEIIRHRGPDDAGIRRGERYVFAHRRLSIIDLAHGHQPMGNEDGTVWLAYNGEVYNFMPLREELLAKGHVFQTRCDTEVIIHLYEEEGPACVERLNGMFAFALFDEQKQQVLLARDRAGIKPLYYSFDGSAVRFASEAKALVQTAPRLVSPDPRSLVDFFALSVIQEGRTAFEGISELLPAHVLIWDTRTQPRTTRYWQPSYATKTTLAGEELTGAVSALLTEAVESHLVSDVPVGTYLSGGLDSSVVSAIADDYINGLNTFSAGFIGEEKVDERVYAREMAASIGSRHHEVEVGPGNFLGNLRKIIWHMDEPTLSPGVYPYYFLCGLVADSVKVVLGGQGSDELFGGYPRYRMALLEKDMAGAFHHGRLVRLAGLLSEYRHRYGLGGLKNGLRRLNADDGRRIYEIVSGFHPRRLPGLFTDELKQKVAGYDPMGVFYESLSGCDSPDLIDNMLYNDFHNMLPSILRTEDRMSMAHSIESRVPFLDYRLVELAASIPSQLKVSGDEPKLILKEAARGKVPESIITRRKQGFSAPIDSWFMGALGGEVRGFLLDGPAANRGYFDRRYVDKVITRALEKKKDIWRVWSMVTFEMWCRIYADGEGPESPS
ncbi:MAG: asparagine synthase (glutamine-hydrolyzing) [Actinobacteria bacterium]|nr:asparagine synthase (glutamine-hydrolyzing) [Actinomycetota bacterium]